MFVPETPYFGCQLEKDGLQQNKRGFDSVESELQETGLTGCTESIAWRGDEMIVSYILDAGAREDYLVFSVALEVRDDTVQ